MTHKLTIRFAGICTNFRYGTAAGVPHRVVLPDASRFITEQLTVGGESAPMPVAYYLLPHFGQLEVAGMKLDVPPGGGGAIQDGDIVSAVRLQVLNAVEREMVYADGETPRLTEFLPHYAFATEVALAGRATCYFDLYGGTVSTRVAPGGGALQTVVDLTTDGPPALLVTPLVASTSPVQSFVLDLGPGDAVTLDVKNLELEDAERNLAHQNGAFDFLLHYLTARGGIPETIAKRTPGMQPENLVSATRDTLGHALEGLGAMVRGKQQPPAVHERRKLVHPDEVTLSCSASNYP